MVYTFLAFPYSNIIFGTIRHSFLKMFFLVSETPHCPSFPPNSFTLSSQPSLLVLFEILVLWSLHSIWISQWSHPHSWFHPLVYTLITPITDPKSIPLSWTLNEIAKDLKCHVCKVQLTCTLIYFLPLYSKCQWVHQLPKPETKNPFCNPHSPSFLTPYTLAAMSPPKMFYSIPFSSFLLPYYQQPFIIFSKLVLSQP